MRSTPEEFTMTMNTMTEKDMFLKTWDMEHQITRRVLAAIPAGKEDFRPAEKTRTVREQVFMFFAEEKVIEGVAQPNFVPQGPPPAPPLSVAELTKMYEQSHAAIYEKYKALPMDQYERVIKFPVGPGQIGDVRVADVAWMMLSDSIHHRGQLSTYLRILGAVVPPIYGPTAETPWF
jgi:uncharacterized damage-inducible protein DinB